MNSPALPKARRMPTRATTMSTFMTGFSHSVRGGVAARWIVTLAGLATVLVTARLGLWQLDRARQKEAIQASVEARVLMPELQLAALANDPADAAVQHHRVARVSGHWMPEHTVFLDNRPMNGRPGFYVLTPLRLDDGSAILVQRGWQPRDRHDPRRTQPVPSPTDTMVQVRGRVAPPPSRLMEFAPAEQGPIRQNLDWNAFPQEIGRPLRPVTLQQLEPALVCDASLTCDQTLNDELRRDWTVVAGSADKNRGYATQWFALSVLVLVLMVWFQVWRPWRGRRQAAAQTPTT